MSGLRSIQSEKRKLFALVAMLLILSAVVFSLYKDKPVTTATWIWDATIITEQADDVIAFAKENGVNLIYLHIEQNKIAPDQYRSFIKAAGQAGIKVDALGGDRNWALTDNQSNIASFISWVKDYNSQAAEAERFQGIHVDIEPYLLSRWEKHKDDVIEQWMENMEFVVSETKKDPGLTVSADLPFWIDTLKVPGDSEKVSSWMLDRLDSITLMAYRNYAEGPNGIVDITQRVLADANDRKKASVIVGVNILESKEGDNVSFHKQGTTEMERELSILQSALAQSPSFAGYAVHDYKSWRKASQ
ncbi:UNVERIFIED_CONTAM: GTP:adenosylcobinamide-phosphate guanylyltransferase [Brevibacillus sp. OAP136]